MTLKRELRNGLENILNTLILSKSSQYIYKYEQVCIIQIFETWWPSGRALDSIYRGHGFKQTPPVRSCIPKRFTVKGAS